MLKRLLIIILVLCLAAFSAACKNDSTIVGSWALDGHKTVEMLGDQVDEQHRAALLTLEATMVLEEDGSFTMGLGPDVTAGTYEVTSTEGNVFNTVMNNEDGAPDEISFTLEGDTLSGVFGTSGRVLYFNRN